MAFYDNLTSPLGMGGETEEERRRREEEERLRNESTTPFKQTIVTDPVTGKQTMKMEGAVEDFSAANPNTPTVVAPVAPTPAPTPGPEQPSLLRQYAQSRLNDVNQRVSDVGQAIQNPEDAIRKRLGLPQQGVTAPTPEGIMAGPPVSAMPQPEPTAPVAPQQPGPMTVPQPTELNQLPQGVAPTAALQPTPPAVPTAQGAPTMSMAARAALERQQPQPTTAPTAEMGPPTSAMTDTAWADRFISAQKNPNQMASLQADQNQPEWLRRLAAEENYNVVKQQKDEQKAEAKVTKALQTGDMLGLAREIQKAGTDGSVIKAYLYSRFGLNDLAKEEQQKLGAGLRWETSVDSKGNTALVQYSGDGLPLKGYDPTGKELTTDQLAGFGSQTAIMKGAQAGSTLYIDPVTKQSLSKVDTLRGPIYYNTAGQRVIPQGQPYPLNTGSNIDLQQQLQLQKIRIQLEGDKAENRIKTLESLNAVRIKEGQPPFSLADVGLDTRGNFTTRGAVTQAQVQPTPAGVPSAVPTPVAGPSAVTAPVAPSAATTVPAPTTTTPVTGVAQPGSTTGAIERSAEAQKEIVKAAGDVIKNQSNIVKDLGDAQRTIKILESGKTNFGTVIGGTIPGERAIGELFKTDDAVRTKNVMEYVNKIASSNVKALGANPTDRDLIFVTSNIPDETWNEKDVANWIRRSEKGLRNSIRIAREQIRTGGAYEEPLPPETPAGSTGSTEGMSPAEKARIELENRRKKGRQ